jgi:Xaa-Pro dipeptidase
MPTVPAVELEHRHATLARALRAAEPPIDALIVLQKADLYWVSGTVQQAHLVLSSDGQSRLLVRKVLERARDDSPLSDIVAMRSLRELAPRLRELCGTGRLRVGMELDVIPVATFRTYQAALGEEVEIVDATPLFLRARSLKSAWEIEQVRASGSVHRELFARAATLIEESRSTFELQQRLNGLACELGHCGMIRMRGLDVDCATGLVVSGPDGALPSHSMFPIGGRGVHPWVSAGGTRDPILRDTPITMDYLISRYAYHADATRMAVLGRFPAEAQRIYDGLREVLHSIESRLVDGAVPARIYSDALELVETLGLAHGFMGPGLPGAPNYQVRFVGHGVGLEVNEVPVLAPGFEEPLRAGMVLAVEPKYTHPAYGVIGIENTYVVRAGGCECLTPASEEVIVAG